MFNFLKTSTPAASNAASSLTAKRNYNLAHSKSRVANVLRKPGQVTYTNKERIQQEYEKAVGELRKIEKPAETAGALNALATKLRDALNSAEAKQTGAVVITIPVGVAQLAYKAMLLFIAALVFVFWDIPTMGTIPLSAYIAPNASFNTTKDFYGEAKHFVGMNSKRNVLNYK